VKIMDLNNMERRAKEGDTNSLEVLELIDRYRDLEDTAKKLYARLWHFAPGDEALTEARKILR